MTYGIVGGTRRSHWGHSGIDPQDQKTKAAGIVGGVEAFTTRSGIPSKIRKTFEWLCRLGTSENQQLIHSHVSLVPSDSLLVICFRALFASPAISHRTLSIFCLPIHISRRIQSMPENLADYPYQ